MNVHNRTISEATPGAEKTPLSVGDRLRRMSRHPLLILLAFVLTGAGVAVVYSYIQSKPVTLKIAVGPKQSEDYRLVQSLAAYLSRERAPVRLKVIHQDSSLRSAEAIDAGGADLAVVRRDVAMPKAGQVIAVHRKNVAVLIVPPPVEPAAGVASAAAKTAKSAKQKPAKKARGTKAAESKETPKAIEKIEDLHGKTIAIVGQTRANISLLHTILAQYGVSADKITTLQFNTDDLTTQLKAAKFDALPCDRPGRQQDYRRSGHRARAWQGAADISRSRFLGGDRAAEPGL